MYFIKPCPKKKHVAKRFYTFSQLFYCFARLEKIRCVHAYSFRWNFLNLFESLKTSFVNDNPTAVNKTIFDDLRACGLK